MQPAASTPGPSSGSPLRILVAEDEAVAADAIAALLSDAGHRPVVARNGLEALELSRTSPPDVALLDLGLPGLDGLRLAEQIRQSAGDRQPLLVAVTGRGSALDRVCTDAAGFDQHIVKPVDPDQLLALLNRYAQSVRH